MTERAYTVSEIDALRAALRAKMISWRSVSCFTAEAEEREDRSIARETAMVEDAVRTHMLAGHTAVDFPKST